MSSSDKSATVKAGSRSAIARAVKVLKSGGLIVFPTETSYGLGADAKNRKAIAATFKAKQSPQSKRISVMVADKAMAKEFFEVTPVVERLIDVFLPGPLTIITKGRSFRIPDHPFCRRLAKALGRPVTSTSANLAGQGDCYSVSQARDSLKGVALFIDGGRLPKRRPSTVFDADSGVILRKGPISKARIEQALKVDG